MTFPIPTSALAQHTAILGKTGSGKTSTGKLVVEHVVDLGERVCILDPIKSDWWGLTSSADGKRPGLPFQILGGPHGHVALHDGAGAAIAELVATGALPLSIIDMADFGPGGQARFFVDFAPVLLRRMRGVLRLVVGEAHLFAPKERSGLGAENMAIHWAKVLATAGRSKGIRLVVETQSVQQLHNRVLGSCENLVAMRLTTPADQKPVIDWLKANAPKDVEQQIRQSLASLKTGTGWLCSGEAGLFERVAFDRIRTFDNSATPEHGDDAHQVVQAQVDQQQLRALIGTAVAEAEANDPKKLKARIAELEEQLEGGDDPRTDEAAVEAAEREGYRRGREAGFQLGYHAGTSTFEGALSGVIKTCNDLLEQLREISAGLSKRDGLAHELADRMRAELGKLVEGEPARKQTEPAAGGEERSPADTVRHVPPRAAPAAVRGNGHAVGSSPITKAMPRAMLTSLAQHPRGLTKAQVRIHTGYRDSGPVSSCFAELATSGWTEMRGGLLFITRAGLAALGQYEPLPRGRALREHLLNGSKLSTMEKALLQRLFAAYPMSISKGKVRELAGYADSGPVSSAFAKLVALGYAVKAGRDLKAAVELFE